MFMSAVLKAVAGEVGGNESTWSTLTRSRDSSTSTPQPFTAAAALVTLTEPPVYLHTFIPPYAYSHPSRKNGFHYSRRSCIYVPLFLPRWLSHRVFLCRLVSARLPIPTASRPRSSTHATRHKSSLFRLYTRYNTSLQRASPLKFLVHACHLVV
jgi:hypothetical protein